MSEVGQRLGVGRRKVGSSITLDYFRERSVVDENGCWIFQGAIARNGYGVIKHGEGTTRAHRAAYIAATGEALTRSVDVCHRCDVRACCNPDHLFAGSRSDNMKDCASKGRNYQPALAGDDCPNSKLTAAQAREIRKDPRSTRVLGAAYGVNRKTISSIKRGLTWRTA